MFPRSTMNHVQGTMCGGIFGKYCDKLSNFLFGQSESQRNDVSILRSTKFNRMSFFFNGEFNITDPLTHDYVPQSKWNIN